MFHFSFHTRKYLFFVMIFSPVLLSLLVVNLEFGIAHATVANTRQTAIPAYEITTRGNLFNAQGVNGSGYHNKYQLSDITNLNNICPDEIAIFVHGWGQNETEAQERFDRVKMSLENNNYTYPLVGFSWDADTEWMAAKFEAKWNGPKLADFIIGLMDNCKQQHHKDVKVRLLGHSLGARVVLSTLDSLHKNAIWNINNFRITSVDLMGAAVDDEEVTTNPKYILDDKTNWGSPKSDYGQAIEEEVTTFSNLYSSEDNVLEPKPEITLPVYPLFELDSALGQSGHQKYIALPKNYNDSNDIDVTQKISAINDSDGIEAEVYGLCYNNNDYCKIKNEKWDLGFCNLFVKPPLCQKTINNGDNHAGYIGFRNNKDLLADDGAMDVVVSNWRTNG